MEVGLRRDDVIGGVNGSRSRDRRGRSEREVMIGKAMREIKQMVLMVYRMMGRGRTRRCEWMLELPSTLGLRKSRLDNIDCR